MTHIFDDGRLHESDKGPAAMQVGGIKINGWAGVTAHELSALTGAVSAQASAPRTGVGFDRPYGALTRYLASTPA